RGRVTYSSKPDGGVGRRTWVPVGVTVEHYVRPDDESVEAPVAGSPKARTSFLRRVAGLLNLVVPDKRPPRPPVGLYIPNSSGEGGKIISSGHPDIRTSGHPDIRTSGHPDIRAAGAAEPYP